MVRGFVLVVGLAAARDAVRAPHTVTPTSALAGITAGTTPDSVSGVKGQTIAIPLRADMASSGKLLGSYTVSIAWDSTVVRLDSVKAADYTPPSVNYVSGGELRLTAANANGVGGAFNLVQLYFRFVNDTTSKRTVITPTFSEFNSTDLSSPDLRASLTTTTTIARILSPTVIVKFSPDSVGERVGYKPVVMLTADLSSAPGVALGSYTAKFTWDGTKMALDSVRAGDFAAPTTNQPNAGEFRLTAADANGKGGAPFTLAKLYFRFTSVAFPSTIALNLGVSEMHAAISFANLLPGVTAANGKAVILGVLRGDIDLNGALAALDAQLILQGVVGLSLPQGLTGTPQGDADCDSTLTAKDAQIVLNYVVGNAVPQFCVGKIQ